MLTLPEKFSQNRSTPGRPPRTRTPKWCAFVCADEALLAVIHPVLSAELEMQCFGEPQELLAALERAPRADLVIFPWQAVWESLTHVLHIRRLCPSVRLLMLSGDDDDMDTGQTMSGVDDIAFLQKPFAPVALLSCVAALMKQPAEEMALARESVLDSKHSFVRASKAMHEVERQASLVASSDIPVLILGESGTGKEILATFLHSQSSRKEQIFMKINCAAMPAELLESELFGYEQGAFTGAHRAKPGKFEVCDGGTIFLDEIGEMPAGLQAKLLHVLQDGTFSRLGGRSTQRVDVRVISATNIAIQKAMESGRFREDLYYRLNGISIKLPPLRERREEIPALIRHFIAKATNRFHLEPVQVSPSLQKAMLEYHWPGNLRELENLITRLLVLRDETAVLSELTRPALPAPAVVQLRAEEHGSPAASLSGESLDPNTITRVLEENLWNRRAAADALHISYKQLLYKIKVHHLARKTA